MHVKVTMKHHFTHMRLPKNLKTGKHIAGRNVNYYNSLECNLARTIKTKNIYTFDQRYNILEAFSQG